MGYFKLSLLKKFHRLGIHVQQKMSLVAVFYKNKLIQFYIISRISEIARFWSNINSQLKIYSF